MGSFILPVNPFTMDVHSSSLLSSTAPAPDQLAEERSALSQVYSDTLSSDPESSPQPLPSPQVTSQDATDVTDESILIGQIVDNLKNLECFDIFRNNWHFHLLKFRKCFINIGEFWTTHATHKVTSENKVANM